MVCVTIIIEQALTATICSCIQVYVIRGPTGPKGEPSPNMLKQNMASLSGVKSQHLPDLCFAGPSQLAGTPGTAGLAGLEIVTKDQAACSVTVECFAQCPAGKVAISGGCDCGLGGNPIVVYSYYASAGTLQIPSSGTTLGNGWACKCASNNVKYVTVLCASTPA